MGIKYFISPDIELVITLLQTLSSGDIEMKYSLYVLHEMRDTVCVCIELTNLVTTTSTPDSRTDTPTEMLPIFHCLYQFYTLFLSNKMLERIISYQILTELFQPSTLSASCITVFRDEISSSVEMINLALLYYCIGSKDEAIKWF